MFLRRMKTESEPTSEQSLQRSHRPVGRGTRAPSWTNALPLQPKLTINQPGDQYEQEADRMAHQVMRTPSTSLQRKGADIPHTQAPPSVHQTLQSSGQPLDTSTRAFMEPRFGQDFSSVRVHTGSQAAQSAADVNASAYTVGQNIVFAKGQYAPSSAEGQHLLAHELAHTVQQSSTSSQVQRQVPLITPETTFKAAVAGTPVSAADAHTAIDAYRKVVPVANRFLLFQSQYPLGNIGKLLKALSPKDVVTFRQEIAELLRWVEEIETRTASGMDDAKMAGTQAAFVKTEAEKKAQADIDAKTPKGVVPPKASAADVEKARKEKVEATSIPPSAPTGWAAMKPAEKTKWQNRAKVVIKAVVAHATKVAPELNLTDADFLADFPGVEGRGKGVLAYGQGGGPKGTLAVFGFEFVKAAEANVAYVMEVVVHEMFGHPEYGAYGTEYHLALYDKAMAKVPGYVKPTGAGRTTEIDAYAYQETEIYSLLRGFAFHKDVEKKDVKKKLVTIDAPSWISSRVGIIKSQWEPGLATSIVRGMYQRFRLDPRIVPAALTIFENAVKANFDAKTAANILK